jgi:hypothetical protein
MKRRSLLATLFAPLITPDIKATEAAPVPRDNVELLLSFLPAGSERVYSQCAQWKIICLSNTQNAHRSIPKWSSTVVRAIAKEMKLAHPGKQFFVLHLFICPVLDENFNLIYSAGVRYAVMDK